MLVEVSRPKSAACGGSAAGALPSTLTRHAGQQRPVSFTVCVSSATPRGEEGGGQTYARRLGEGSLGALTPSNSYTAPGDKLVVLGHRHRGHVDNVQTGAALAPPILTRAGNEGS